MMKTCTLCNNIKSYDDYYVRPNGKPYSQCRACKKISQRKWYEKDMNNLEKYNIDGKECPNCNTYKNKDEFYVLKRNGQMSTYCINCELEKFNWKNDNRKQTKQKWRNNNKEKVRSSSLSYHHNVRKMNTQYLINQSVRSRIHNALFSHVKKSKKTVTYLGCNIDYFKKWLEFQFSKNMSWDNYGSYWEIDHVIPCASFNLKNEDEQLKCFNWKNCQPMITIQNRSKKDKIILNLIFLQKLKVILFEKNVQHIQIAGTSL